ncbi:hypothetical protein PAHAL_8G263000 [Panicum hallii]|uniref:Uncharacterized protein n=1 Tax=Panicum hallii TaxID=206008 RepID=A0A2T8IAE0_9POAL|nr:uncharacterized protein LOC112901944 isoform X1 [Panicum hallii]PVH34634.1 hypothetical protein PAHAL_8G263000 [Panicum hallii]
MAAATARAPAADKRWGFAAAAAPSRTPAVGVPGTAPKPSNMSAQRDAFPWGNRPIPPAPNAWVSSSLLSLKNDGGSGSFGNINDRPSTGGSSRTSSDGSDLLDSPLARGGNSHNSTTAISHPQITDLKSGSSQFPRSQTSFSDVLKAPLRTIAKMRPTSHGKGFTLSADDFPVLVSKNSQSNSQQGHSFQGRPTFSSVTMAARDEQRKILTTGGDPVSATNFSMEAQPVQLHATQTPDICMPPPCIDYWHPPPDHPPDRNEIWHGGMASYGPCKPADTPGSFPVESFSHNDQFLLNQRGEARHGTVPGGYHPKNKESCCAHVPADACINDLPHLMLGKVKHNHSDALEKKVIKKDVALLEKIKCLNIKARNRLAGNISEISSRSESKVEHPETIDLEAYHVTNDVPFSVVISDITSAFDMANSVSESINLVPIGTSNVSASANLVMVDLSGHVTKFSEGRKLGGSADNHVYGVGNTSRNKHRSSVTDTASDIWGPGWEEHSTVDSLPVAMTNTHEVQPFAGNSSQQVHVRTGDDMLNSPDYEIQLSRRELSAQHARQLQKEEMGKLQQNVTALENLEELNRSSFVQNLKLNNVPLEADKILCKQSAGGDGTTNHDTSTSDTCCTAYAENLNVPLRANGTKNTTVPISSTPPPGTAGVNRGPLTHNLVPSAKKTDINMLEHSAQKRGAQPRDGSAPNHLQVGDSKGLVHRHESISRVSTPASNTADANNGPLIQNAIPSAKSTAINMIHIDQKSASESHDSTAPMLLQMKDKRRQVHSLEKILRGLPASESAGGNKGSLIHNVLPSAKNNGINMMEYIAWKSASQSHENSAPKHLQIENRRRQVLSQERVLRERSNIAESTENITTVTGTLVDTQNAEAKPRVDLSTQSKNRRLASPYVFGNENKEASNVHKTHITGVVINSAIIPVQVSSVRGFTVGSIMLGDASLGSVNQEKTVAKEVHDDVTNGCASPKQTKQSGMNQHGVQRVKSEAGGLNCMAILAPTQPSMNESIVPQNLAQVKTSVMERHAHTPACKELGLQNPKQMPPAENHISSDNSSTSKLDTKTPDKEALGAPTATKAEAKTEPENREDEKTSKHLGRSSAASNQGSTNSSFSAAPDLNEQKANSFVLKIMQELSDQLEQVEKQIESSTHVATVNCSQPTQMVSLPGYNWGEHHASPGQRQYHVDGQGNMWINYAMNSHMDRTVMTQGATLLTGHLLPGPISVPVPQNNVPGINGATGWMWDTSEGVLISDTSEVPGLGTAITAGSFTKPTQNVYRFGHGMVGGMAYGAAVGTVSSEVWYQPGPELEQLNPAWFPHDGMHHHGGTSVYMLGMDHGAGAQTHGGGATRYVAGAGPLTVGAGGPDCQLVPVAPPVAAWTSTGGTMASAGCPAEAWDAAYGGKHVYYV